MCVQTKWEEMIVEVEIQLITTIMTMTNNDKRVRATSFHDSALRVLSAKATLMKSTCKSCSSFDITPQESYSDSESHSG